MIVRRVRPGLNVVRPSSRTGGGPAPGEHRLHEVRACFTGLSTPRAWTEAYNNKDVGWLDPLAKLYDHEVLNCQAVLECAFQSPDGICVNDNLKVPRDAQTLVSLKPDPSRLCWFLAAQAQGAHAAATLNEPAGLHPPVVPSQGP